MSIKNLILPIPQEFEYLEGSDIILGVPGKAFYQIDTAFECKDSITETAVNLLIDTLSKTLNVSTSDRGEGVKIILTIEEAPKDIANPEQAYSVVVLDNKITITGFGLLGLYYGVVTLKQCLIVKENVLKLPSMQILDWPDLKTRGHFMESRYGSNLMTLGDWKYLVDHMADMKMNQLVVSLYGSWEVQYDGRVSEYFYVPIKKYPKLKVPVVTRYYSPRNNGWVDSEQLPPMYQEDFFGDLIAYGKTKGVTIFPLFNSYGHNTLIPSQYPQVSAKDENGEPSLSGFCTSNPKTYEIMYSIYDEIIDRYLLPNGIESFHVGLDEVWDGIGQNAEDIFKMRSPWCKCSECREISRNDLFINHAIKLLKHLKSRGIKNIYMYHDMLINPGEAGSGEDTESMAKALQENDLMDEVVIDWWTYSDYQEELMFQTTRPDLGFRRTVKPWNGYYHWTILTNPLRNIQLLAKMGNAEGVEGMQSYSAWDESYDRNHSCQADYSWNYEGTGSIDQVTNRYTERNFGPQYDKARRAFELIDLITEVRSPVLSKYNIVLNIMSYYFYSYVREGKPYPRIFPGEALKTMDLDRENYLRAINEIAAMSKEAADLLSAVAADPRCNTRLAERFLYETLNYRCLAEDYLSLFKMIEICDACHHRYSARDIERIKTIAIERKLARLALMTRLEETKEDFLLASHMRNQTIFMQFFADLEGYLAKTKVEDIKLDFFDMRYIESEAFKKLR